MSTRITPTIQAALNLLQETERSRAIHWLTTHTVSPVRAYEVLSYFSSGALDVRIVDSLSEYAHLRLPSLNNTSIVGKTVIIRPATRGRWGKRRAVRVMAPEVWLHWSHTHRF